MDEHTLMMAYARVDEQPAVVPDRMFRLGRLTFRPCVCGSWLGCDPRNPEEMQATLLAHESTARHVAWRRQTQWSAVWEAIWAER